MFVRQSFNYPAVEPPPLLLVFVVLWLELGLDGGELGWLLGGFPVLDPGLLGELGLLGGVVGLLGLVGVVGSLGLLGVVGSLGLEGSEVGAVVPEEELGGSTGGVTMVVVTRPV
jgi:hypothetical protein